MKLYFVRHATAEKTSAWDEDDDLRPLTRTGRTRFRTAAKALVAAGVLAPDRILTSPLVRAVQTAGILNQTVGGNVPVEEVESLGHGFGLDDLRELLGVAADVDSLAIVGHNPGMREVLQSLTGGCELDVRKGAIALVEITDTETPAGRLLWLAPPTLFRPCP